MPVNPNQIDVREQFYEAFGRYEAEFSANIIVRFCQERGQGWAPFSYADINRFYKKDGRRDNFTFDRLIDRGHIVMDDDQIYHITNGFVNRCFKASLIIKTLEPSHKAIYAKDKLVGSLSQHPDSPRVMNPGKWGVTIHTSDEGLTTLGLFNTEPEALKAAINGLVKNLTYEQWMMLDDETNFWD